MYIYVYVCMYIYIYVCVCMYVCMYVCMHACMHACIYIYVLQVFYRYKSFAKLYKTLLDILSSKFMEDTNSNFPTFSDIPGLLWFLLFHIAAAVPKCAPSPRHAVAGAAGTSEASSRPRGGKTRRRRHACSQMQR